MSNNIIYPKVEFRNSPYNLTVLTYLRKQGKDGKWYKIFFCKSAEKLLFDSDITKIENQLIHWLHAEVYNFIICGIIDANNNLTTLDGRDLFVLDENQYSEEDRIEALCNYLPIELILERKKKKEDYPFNYNMNYE